MGASSDFPPVTRALREMAALQVEALPHGGTTEAYVLDAARFDELCDQVDALHRGLERDLAAEHALAEQLGHEAELAQAARDSMAEELARVTAELAAVQEGPCGHDCPVALTHDYLDGLGRDALLATARFFRDVVDEREREILRLRDLWEAALERAGEKGGLA